MSHRWTTTITVSEDGAATVQVPPDVPPGIHRVVLEIEESTEEAAGTARAGGLDLRAEAWENWPGDSRFRRSELYSDEGR
jgi:hypothetical protein